MKTLTITTVDCHTARISYCSEVSYPVTYTDTLRSLIGADALHYNHFCDDRKIPVNVSLVCLGLFTDNHSIIVSVYDREPSQEMQVFDPTQPVRRSTPDHFETARVYFPHLSHDDDSFPITLVYPDGFRSTPVTCNPSTLLLDIYKQIPRNANQDVRFVSKIDYCIVINGVFDLSLIPL